MNKYFTLTILLVLALIGGGTAVTAVRKHLS